MFGRKMKMLSLVLRNVKILESGFGGGFIYLFGQTEFPPHGTVDAYAYFSDSTEENNIEERNFQETYSGGDLTITTDSWDYQPSTGLSLKKIKWEYAEPNAAPN